jgi:hypothetical protein
MQSILPCTVSISLVCVLTWYGRGLGPRRVEAEGGLEEGCVILGVILGVNGEDAKSTAAARGRRGRTKQVQPRA